MEQSSRTYFRARRNESRLIENIIVKDSKWHPRDISLLFGTDDDPEVEVHFTEAKDIPNLLKELGIFKSTSAARRAGRTGPIPEGWTDEFKASKTKRLWIWNPT